MGTSYEDVEGALRRVPGVAAASVGAGSAAGKGKLNIRLAPGHDARAVAVAVSEVLRQRFGIRIDPDEIRPRPEEPSMADGNGHRAPSGDLRRAAIRELLVDVDGLEVSAVAVLDLEGRVVRGTATGAATTDASLRAVARATLDAVDHLVPGRAKTDLVTVEVTGHGEARHATVTVTYLTATGEDRLAGVSLIGDGDVEAAVMRATLDAVNRRLETLLERDVQSAG